MRALAKAVALTVIAVASATAQRAPLPLPPRPEVPPAKAPAFPKVTYDTLPNGLRFAVVERRDLPLVVVQTAIVGQGPFGAWTMDPAGKNGAFGLMLAALREGTPTRSAAQIVDEMLDLGTEMRFTASPAFSPPAFTAATTTWRPSLNLLADLMMNATLSEEALTRARATAGAILDRLPPQSIANRGMVAGLYGPESPLAQFPTSASLKTVTREDIVALRDTYLRPQNTIVVVAGDVSVGDARGALARAFGAWQRGGTTIAVQPVNPTPAPTTIYLKDSPNAPTVMISAGQLVPGREHADAPAIDALASVLGNFAVSAGSRVYSAFRLERGLSYSPAVSLGTRPLGEKVPLFASLIVAPTVADTAIDTYLRVIRELKQDKPAQEAELDFARRNMMGSLPGSLELIESVAFTVAYQMRDGVPPDYLANWVKRIGALTLPEVQAAAARYLDPDHMAISVVADRAKVEAALRATGLPIVILP